MRSRAATFLASLSLACLLAAPAAAQQAAASPGVATPTPPPHPARELTISKCFQCHSEAMWRDQRLDARAWEATLYRMLARGAVWSADEIKTMAAFLAADFGPQSPKSAPISR